MSEKWIVGKHDSAAHVGLYSNVKAEQASLYALEDGISQMEEHGVIFQHGMKPNRLRQSENLAIFTGFWRGNYYDHGQVRKSK